MLPIPFAFPLLGALGLVLALAFGEARAAELRRWVHPMRSLVLTCLGLFVVVPSWYVAIRYPDWYVSYVFSASTLPQVLCAVLATLVSSSFVVGFWVGAAGLSARRVDLLAALLVALVVVLLLVCGAFGRRLGLVGTQQQFARGTFLVKLVECGLGRALLWGAMVQLLAFAYLVRALRSEPKSDTERSG